MPIRYYPLSKIKAGKKTNGGEFLLDGKSYRGSYYQTFDGQYYTGVNPIIGKNEKLTKITNPKTSIHPQSVVNKQPRNMLLEIENTEVDMQSIAKPVFPVPQFKGVPTSYFPLAVESDYSKGYLTRYFIKKTNSKGYVTEISPEEHAAVLNGAVPYDVSFWQTIEIFWKLTGPLKAKRISQYQVRAGIIDTNQRLIENADKTFVGIKDFINGEYDKFARVTE